MLPKLVEKEREMGDVRLGLKRLGQKAISD
jgi:hypothetical protein